MATKSPSISLAASSAFRWTECTASPQFLVDNADRIPPQDTKYNKEGTLAHQVADAILNKKPLPKDATREMVKHGKAYAAFCNSLIVDRESQWQTEQKVDLWYMPGRNGYVDFASHNPKTGVLHIVDYKYGAGVLVGAEDNKQMAIYARSYVEHKFKQGVIFEKPDEVQMHIYQPRFSGDEESQPHSTWMLSWERLVQFTNQIESEVQNIFTPGTDKQTIKFSPSNKTCQFCPAESFCTARARWLIEGLDDLDNLLGEAPVPALPEATTLTDKMLAKILAASKPVEKWFESIREYARARARQHKPVEGWKLVRGRSVRVWKDEQDAVETLRIFLRDDQIFSTSIISPPQAEELISEKCIASLVLKVNGAPVLAGPDDKRESVLTDPNAVFEDLDEDYSSLLK